MMSEKSVHHFAVRFIALSIGGEERFEHSKRLVQHLTLQFIGANQLEKAFDICSLLGFCRGLLRERRRCRNEQYQQYGK